MRAARTTLIAAAFAIGPAAELRAGGFDRAIESVVPKAVKLYGMGAGLQAGFGTGVIVSEDGLVLTVFSLLIDARRIKAVDADGSTYEAEVLYRDLDRHLALLRLKHWDAGPDAAAPGALTTGPFPFFDLSQEAALEPGDWVVAGGNAFKVAEGAEPVSLAHGIFSIRTRLDARRNLKDFPYRGDVLVIDAITSNPGAPGSPLVNLDGQFVGMIGRVVTSNRTHTHFNYAIPRDVLREFLTEATAGETTADGSDAAGLPRPSRTKPEPGEAIANIGIRLSAFGYRKVLPFVEQVRAGSPAERAGLRKDDLILSVNGATVQDVASCESRLALAVPGEPVDLVIRRGRTNLSMQIQPEPRP